MSDQAEDTLRLALQRIVARHQGVPRAAGPRRTVLRCKECDKQAPCDTSITARRALELAPTSPAEHAALPEKEGTT